MHYICLTYANFHSCLQVLGIRKSHLVQNNGIGCLGTCSGYVLPHLAVFSCNIQNFYLLPS